MSGRPPAISTSGQVIADYDAGAAIWSAPSIRPDGTLVVADRTGRVLVLGESYASSRVRPPVGRVI